MENLDLRKAVAEANGCKVKMINICQKHLPYCDCEDHRHASGVCYLLPPYEIDHHPAIDALEEYALKTGLDYDIGRRGINKFKVTIYTDDGIIVRNKSLALAICEAIKSAAEGRGHV